MVSVTAMRAGAPVAMARRTSGRTSVRTTALMSKKGAKTTSSKGGEMSAVDYVMTLPGASAPFDKPYFDPAGFSKTAKVSDIKRWRESELTHGRVAMLAALGFVVGEQLEDFPTLLNWDGDVTGPAITHFQQIEEKRPLFWEVLVVSIGLAESFRVSTGWATPKGTGFNNLQDDYEPGNLGFDPLGLKPEDPEELRILQTKELNNGRLAMIGIAGFVAQELVENTGIFEHLARRLEYEVILELDDIERDLGLPITQVPEIVLKELGK